MYRLIFITLLFLSGQLFASAENQVGDIIAGDDEPFGVVFEIAEGDEKDIKWSIQAINNYVKQLRKRFPDLSLAVVSHGSEQFGLMKSEQKKMAKTHKMVQSLVASNVPVQVCGTHASWRGKGADDFPDYIDVTPAGPTQIRNYVDMGYVLIVIE